MVESCEVTHGNGRVESSKELFSLVTSWYIFKQGYSWVVSVW